MKKFLQQYGLLIFIAGVIIILDQVTKAIIRANIPFGGRGMPLEWLAPYFRFVHWENTGAAFGLFQQGGVIFGILAVIVSVFFLIYYPQVPKEDTLMRVALAMQGVTVCSICVNLSSCTYHAYACVVIEPVRLSP